MQYQIGDWLVDTNETTITHAQTEQQLKLEPIAVELLTLLSRNSGELVTREELFEKIWNGRIISDHAIYRVITKLRKALAPDDKNAYIVTVSKRGYKLVKEYRETTKVKTSSGTNGYPNETKDSQISNLENSPVIEASSKTQTKLILFVSCLILLSLAMFEINKYRNKPLPTYNITTPLTTKTGVEKNPVYLDNNKLLFSYQKDENSPANIFLKALDTGLIARLTNNNQTEDNLTASKNGRYIAFTRSYKNKCDVILLEKESNNQYNETNLFECNTLYTDFSNLALTNQGDKLYYIYETAGAHQIFSYLISTGRKTQLTKRGINNHMGEFGLSLSPDNSKLAFIRYPDWESSIVGLIDIKSNKEEILFKENRYIDSLAWSHDNETLYFIKAEKSIHAFLLNKNKQQAILNSLDPNLRKVHTSPFANSVIIHKNSNAIDQGIWKATNPLVTGDNSASELIITSNELDIYPSYANNNNTIAFMSFRSGSQQIWIREENGNERRITDFTDGRIIDHLNWSPDDKHILSLGSKEIYSISIKNDKKTVHLNLENYGKLGHVTWSADGAVIYFSSDISGDMQIHSLDISTGNISQVTKSGAIIAFASNDPEKLYLLKAHQNGLWELDLGSNNEALLFEDIDQESYGGVSIKDNIIYYYSINKGIKYYNTDTNFSGDIELQNLPDTQDFSIPKDASNFIFYDRNINESSIVLASQKTIKPPPTNQK